MDFLNEGGRLIPLEIEVIAFGGLASLSQLLRSRSTSEDPKALGRPSNRIDADFDYIYCELEARKKAASGVADHFKLMLNGMMTRLRDGEPVPVSIEGWNQIYSKCPVPKSLLLQPSVMTLEPPGLASRHDGSSRGTDSCRRRNLILKRTSSGDPVSPRSLAGRRHSEVGMDRSLIEQYEAGAGVPALAIRGLSVEDLDAHPVPGTWSLREIVVHLMDSDLVGSERMKRVIAMEEPSLLGYDESAFARAGLWLDRRRARLRGLRPQPEVDRADPPGAARRGVRSPRPSFRARARDLGGSRRGLRRPPRAPHDLHPPQAGAARQAPGRVFLKVDPGSLDPREGASWRARSRSRTSPRKSRASAPPGPPRLLSRRPAR